MGGEISSPYLDMSKQTTTELPQVICGYHMTTLDYNYYEDQQVLSVKPCPDCLKISERRSQICPDTASQDWNASWDDWRSDL